MYDVLYVSGGNQWCVFKIYVLFLVKIFKMVDSDDDYMLVSFGMLFEFLEEDVLCKKVVLVYD